MSWKKNDWNVNGLFVAWMRISYNEKVKYFSNQGVIQQFKNDYFKKFVMVMIWRKIIRLLYILQVKLNKKGNV